MKQVLTEENAGLASRSAHAYNLKGSITAAKRRKPCSVIK